jgi:lipopolysaccharide/colanic/teichoic acid biosynthesis glycosyltransferase
MPCPYGRRVSVIAKRSGQGEPGVPALVPTPTVAWSRVRSSRRLLRWLDLRRDIVMAPVGGAIVLAVLAPPHDRVRAGLLALCALVSGAALARRVAAQAALLPLMRYAFPLIGPTLGLAGLATVAALTGTPDLTPLDMLAAAGASAFLAQPWAGLFGAPAPGTMRAAFIGSPAAATRLAKALDAGGSHQLVLAGWVSCSDAPLGPGAPPALGRLGELARIVTDNDIDLLVMGAEAPRMSVFAEVTDSCLGLPVRLLELASLFEEVFGHVPTAEINASWFQCLADPRARTPAAPVKRLLDITGSALVLFLTLPLLGVLVLLIRRDGGRAIFTQVRIGEGGRPFRLHKLRTMQRDAGASAQWACADDPRTTRVGGFLRRTHLDELPQLVNVLRGEMSLVGPRPEQPEFVDRLERMLPFYQRRHLLRPGITGWAQIRCGYAGSDIGSAWKLCHDLYYAKHRSTAVDLLILCETFATLFFRREPVMHPENVAFVLADER